MKSASVPKDFVSLQGFNPKLGNNLGTNIAKYRTIRWYVTQEKARRTNYLAFLHLPVTQEVASSNLVGPANFFNDLKLVVMVVFSGM
jgi:hypothetical protein